MLIPVALGIVNMMWMAVIAAIVIAQKLLPLKAAIDVPLALAIVGSRTHSTDVRIDGAFFRLIYGAVVAGIKTVGH